MSRKHYVALAKAIAIITSDDERNRVANLIAEVCSANDPRFDWRKFLQACNVL